MKQRQDDMDEKGGLLRELTKYRFLIKQLVNRDFKTKYKRSVLGVFWSFLNPLLTMVVQSYSRICSGSISSIILYIC